MEALVKHSWDGVHVTLPWPSDGTSKVVLKTRKKTLMARGLANFDPDALRALRTNVYARPQVVPLTAEELARAVGATKAQILAYENGHRVPEPPRIRALAAALKVSPWHLMREDERGTWTLADFRRACGLRAQDVVSLLGVSPKNYRRFENEGIVPSRRPRFLDEVATALGMPRHVVETAIDRTPAVRRRQARAAELVVAMAERYVPRPGTWRGPSLDDPNLGELAAAYGRPVQRIRRVLAHELGELRQTEVRALRERAIAEYDRDRSRQIRARHALVQWHELYDKTLAQIPRRLEQFHRTAQPSDVWQLLVDLYNVEAVSRPDAGTWMVTDYLCNDADVLPSSLVERRTVDDVAVCGLTVDGVRHVQTFASLYVSLYPGVRRMTRPQSRRARAAGLGAETFALPNRTERLVVPDSFLERVRLGLPGPKTHFNARLSATYDLMVGSSVLLVVQPGVWMSRDEMTDEGVR
ncbi:helix-turn-helix transcriptional regulator (plasmid) [Streptomyces phaeoluteigriseus]|uniref:Helix-turn-helix transcriptional regulator n=1 Tax=Streptomyces phaeoluteigriseus TaxID=114686 RepID=A0ABY4ZLL0_9ACTN|nr:helix-turn-helix transcriptional regulator [Streptomyces phaeoluteigriseus]USQ89904.1 helix-turn-helix transcriptional regulator [Streptomyces phaeoluteigriseus]